MIDCVVIANDVEPTEKGSLISLSSQKVCYGKAQSEPSSIDGYENAKGNA